MAFRSKRTEGAVAVSRTRFVRNGILLVPFSFRWVQVHSEGDGRGRLRSVKGSHRGRKAACEESSLCVQRIPPPLHRYLSIESRKGDRSRSSIRETREPISIGIETFRVGEERGRYGIWKRISPGQVVRRISILKRNRDLLCIGISSDETTL